jgi:hypothetical protein
METMRRKTRATRVLVSVLLVSFLCLTCVVADPAAMGFENGVKTPEEAAHVTAVADAGRTFTLAGWKPTSPFAGSPALADTTGLGLPEDEENQRHLIRDIGIFLIVSAFVGYFIVKVFLEGDTQEPPPEGGGKKIPGAATFN